MTLLKTPKIGERFALMFGESAIPTMVINNHRRVLHWNKAIEEMTGCQSNKILQTSDHWKIFSSPGQMTLADLVLKNIHEGKLDVPVGKHKFSPYACRPLHAEMHYKKIGDRSDVWLFQSAYPLMTRNGGVTGIIETFLDITHEKMLEEEVFMLKKRIQEINIIDESSGFYTKKHFIDRIDVEISRAKRYERELSLIYITIDDFDDFRTNHGQVEADRVVRTLFEITYRLFRKTDSTYRRSSDKFVVILPETGPVAATILADRIRRVFEAERHLINHQVFNLSMTAEVLSFTGNENPDDFFNWPLGNS